LRANPNPVSVPTRFAAMETGLTVSPPPGTRAGALLRRRQFSQQLLLSRVKFRSSHINHINHIHSLKKTGARV
jgi:hypothetical protein